MMEWAETNSPEEVKKRPASEDGNDAAKRAKTEQEQPVEAVNSNETGKEKPRKRWIANQLAEDYVGLVHNIMYSQHSQTQQQPHQVMARSRAVTILECWNPREIALFEAGMYLHGKEFHKVQSLIKSKTTKDVVAFYYIWKKTSHYQTWKTQYTSDDESEEEEEGAQE